MLHITLLGDWEVVPSMMFVFDGRRCNVEALCLAEVNPSFRALVPELNFAAGMTIAEIEAGLPRN